jgi:predicted small secreted protein
VPNDNRRWGALVIRTRFLAICSILIAALMMSACANTVRGVGKDVRDTGRAVADSVT